MTTRFHRGDLPAGLSPRPVDRHRHRDARAQPASGPALRGPALDRRRHRRRRPDPDGRPARPRRSSRVLADESVLKIFHFARFDLAVLFHAPRRHAAPGLLHQDRLAPRPHLHGPARPEGPRPGAASAIDLSKQQQSSDWGAETLTPGPARLCGLRRAPPPRPEGAARRHARAREPGSESPSNASRSCRPGPSSTCSAGRRRTFSRIVDGSLKPFRSAPLCHNFAIRLGHRRRSPECGRDAGPTAQGAGDRITESGRSRQQHAGTAGRDAAPAVARLREGAAPFALGALLQGRHSGRRRGRRRSASGSSPCSIRSARSRA